MLKLNPNEEELRANSKIESVYHPVLSAEFEALMLQSNEQELSANSKIDKDTEKACHYFSLKISVFSS